MLALTSGVDVIGRLLDPDGKPLTGGVVSGEVYANSWYPIRGQTFRVEGYYPDRPRELFFYHPDRNLAGYYRLAGESPKELATRLEPAGAIRGRLLDTYGAPLSGIRLRGEGVPDDNSGDTHLRLSTDDAGRFEIRGLIPGRKYTVEGDGDGISGRVLVDATVEASKTKDVADVTLQPPEPATELKPADDDLLIVRGRVLDPQGKPLAGADVVASQGFWKVRYTLIPLAATKTDDAGRFRLEFRKSQFIAGRGEPWRSATIMASVPDARYGMAWLYYDAVKPNQETTLQLAPDEPIEGRIVDLEGRPIAGVEARIGAIQSNAKGDLTTWLAALRGGMPFYTSLSPQYGGPDRFDYMDFARPWVTKTDADGRFHLTGVGHDRLATI